MLTNGKRSLHTAVVTTEAFQLFNVPPLHIKSNLENTTGVYKSIITILNIKSIILKAFSAVRSIIHTLTELYINVHPVKVQ